MHLVPHCSKLERPRDNQAAAPGAHHRRGQKLGVRPLLGALCRPEEVGHRAYGEDACPDERSDGSLLERIRGVGRALELLAARVDDRADAAPAAILNGLIKL